MGSEMNKHIGIGRKLAILLSVLSTLSILSVLCIPWEQPCFCQAENPQQPSKEVEQLFTKLEVLLLEFYPQAKVTRKTNGFQCRFNTRSFLIHHALKTGEWQEARAQEGPNRGGILCSVSESAGRYAGAAMVPQQFEYRYFSSLLMAPYNKKIDRHLIAHLNFPDNVKPQLLRRYSELITSFAQE